jgi:hypothetical protein
MSKKNTGSEIITCKMHVMSINELNSRYATQILYFEKQIIYEVHYPKYIVLTLIINRLYIFYEIDQIKRACFSLQNIIEA